VLQFDESKVPANTAWEALFLALLNHRACVHFGTLDGASQSEMIEEGWTPQCSGCEPSEILTRRVVQYRATKIGGHHRPLSLTQASRQ